MDLTRNDLNLLIALEALLAERSVTGAARRLGLSQPATSDALRRLRVLFGDELFVRSAGAMQPTPRALLLAPGIMAALGDLRATLGAELAFDPRGAAQTFTVAATDYIAHVLLPDLVADLRTEAPGADLHVVGYDKDEVDRMLARGEVDIALGVFPVPPEAAVKTGLFDEHFVGLARFDHPALAGGDPDIVAFAALPHALGTALVSGRDLGSPARWRSNSRYTRVEACSSLR
jgi:DNA-binding transcriptional LysR family regulator